MKSNHCFPAGFFILLLLCLGPMVDTAQVSDVLKNKKEIAVYSNAFWKAYAACRFEEAMDYGKKYYETALQLNDQEEIFNALDGMFSLNRQMGNYEKSFSYIQKL